MIAGTVGETRDRSGSQSALGWPLWGLAALLFVQWCGAWQVERTVMMEQHKIENQYDAIKVAMELTGFGPLSRSAPSAHRITVENDQTPFLAKELNGTAAWQVKFDDLSLGLKSSVPGLQDPYKRNFVALIQEDTGRLWSVKSHSDQPVPDLKPEPSAEWAESQLRPEKEIFVGLPQAYPKINFLDALNIVLSKGNSSPVLAKEIYASYVMESIRGTEPRAVWSITLRGIPPIPVRNPSIPVWQRNRMRNVVDAMTGQLMFATNSPQPQ